MQTEFKDTTEKKINNNKLMGDKKGEMEFKFKVFYMFMKMMKDGKDPIPYMLKIYLSWKDKCKN